MRVMIDVPDRLGPDAVREYRTVRQQAEYLIAQAISHLYPPSAPSMQYEAVPDQFTPGSWCADAIDHDSEGECYKVIFIGPDSEARAREYAAWQSERTQER